MSKSLSSALIAQRDNLKSAARQAADVRDLCKDLNIGKYFAALVKAEPKSDLFVGTYSVIITVPVMSMKHMLEVIEFAETVMGIEFDQSTDYPASGERSFTSSAHWNVTIKATIPLEKQEGQRCERVQTGTKTVDVPIYELQCAD